jgi:hypothetical protein
MRCAADIPAFADEVIAMRRRVVDPGNISIESLAKHVWEGRLSNVLGFARYRNGEDALSPLIGPLRQSASSYAAIQAAKAVFEGAGFQIALSSDQIGPEGGPRCVRELLCSDE